MFEEFYVFVVIIDPFHKPMCRVLYFIHILLNWRLKFIEMRKYLQNRRFYRTIISKYSREVKQKFNKNYQNQQISLQMTHIEKTSLFRLCRLLIQYPQRYFLQVYPILSFVNLILSCVYAVLSCVYPILSFVNPIMFFRL